MPAPHLMRGGAPPGPREARAEDKLRATKGAAVEVAAAALRSGRIAQIHKYAALEQTPRGAHEKRDWVWIVRPLLQANL